MALYDNNGTTDMETAKVYDNDGTLNYQADKLWDNDGTVDSLLYSSEPAIVENGRIVANFITSSSGSKATVNLPYTVDDYAMFEAKAAGNQWCYGYWISEEATDVTNLDSLVVEYGNMRASNDSKLPTERYIHIGLCVDQGKNETFKIKQNFTASSSAASGSFTLDISNLTGNYYFKIYMKTYGNNDTSTYLYLGCKNIVFKENQ